MYDLIGYGDMVADGIRTDCYARALREAVKPDSAVLDIGTGTGLFALLACRFGARHVYAVELGNAIALAREIARANGFEQRITFMQRRSERVTLPEPVDVVVSDVRGVLPLYQRSVSVVLDARRRLLAPGGRMIPRRDLLMVSPVDAPNLYEKHVRPWFSPVHDIDASAAGRYVLNTWHRGRAAPEQLLAEPKRWGELDYTTLESANVRGSADWTVERPGVVHGLSVWFDSELASDVAFSNAPDRLELVYGSAFFPLQEPVAVIPGDRVEIGLRADLVGDDYTWSWTTRIQANGEAGSLKAQFSQSTFFSHPILPAELDKRTASHRPRLSEDGEVALFILRAMQEERTLEQVARAVCAHFPERFPDWQTALGHVGAFSGEYGESPADGVEHLPSRATRS
jgi:protein arginine N-methyltransferase 1